MHLNRKGFPELWKWRKDNGVPQGDHDISNEIQTARGCVATNLKFIPDGVPGEIFDSIIYIYIYIVNRGDCTYGVGAVASNNNRPASHGSSEKIWPKFCWKTGCKLCQIFDKNQNLVSFSVADPLGFQIVNSFTPCIDPMIWWLEPGGICKGIVDKSWRFVHDSLTKFKDGWRGNVCSSTMLNRGGTWRR